MWASHGGEKRLETNDGKWKNRRKNKRTLNLAMIFIVNTSNVCSV